MRSNLFSRVLHFYLEGFKNMGKWGRQVWIIIIVKLFVIFVLLKLFFFPDFLKTKFDTDDERSDYVLEQIIK